MIRAARHFYRVLLLSVVYTIFYFPDSSSQTFNDLIFERIYHTDNNIFGIVEDIQQDTSGFIWMGAKDGLFRYDGIQLSGYFYDRDDTMSLSNSVIRDIFIDSRGTIWVGTENGLNRFIARENRFQRYYNDPDNPESLVGNNVRKISEDSNGNLWMATLGGGVCRYNISESRFEKVDQLVDPGNIGFPSHARTLFIDSHNTVWLGTVDKGVLYFSLDKMQLHQLSSGNADGKHVYGNDIRCITEDKNGRIWIGTNGKGISCYNPSDETFIYYNTDLTGNKKITSDVIWNLYIDSNQTLWASTDGGGLLRLDPGDKAFKVYRHVVNDPNSISSDVVRVFYEDNAGNFWIGNFNAPVNYCNTHRKKFHLLRNFDTKSENSSQNKITSVMRDSENILWICTDGAGLYSFDQASRGFKNYQSKPGDPRSIGNNKPLCIAEDHEGNIWIGLYEGGLSCFLKQQKRFVNFFFDGTDKTPKSEQIWDLLIDGNKLWIAGDQGIENYDLITGRFNHNPFPGFQEPIYGAWNLMLDSENRLWIGTFNGLFIYDKQKDLVSHILADAENLESLSENWVLNTYEDPDKRIWIGTNGGGLNLWKGGDHFECFTIKDGLPGNEVNGILSDDTGNLWISTNKGISRLDIDSLHFTNFDLQDGLQDNRFFINSCYRDDKGILYFGGINGLSYFNPKEIVKNNFIPPVVITCLEIFDKSSENHTSEAHCIENILFKDEINLNYHQVIFTLQFAALNFSHSYQNLYQYKLEGFDEGWHDVGNQHWATYTALRPGKYTFRVIGSNDDGVWNLKGTQLRIIVHPPFYNTLVFRIIIIILVILILVMIYRSRVKRTQALNSRLSRLISERTNELEIRNKEIAAQNVELEKHRSQLEKLVKERTQDLEAAKEKAEDSDKLKTAFIENLSHSIRTPMNAIIGFINLLTEKIDDTMSREYYLRIISENGRNMLRLIEDIIDFSRMQTGQLQPEYNECDANELIRELVSTLRERASLTNSSLSIMADLPGDGLLIFTDEKKLRQIFSKLIENSMKYTEKGYIKIGVTKLEKENITFFVEDTGKGIEGKHIDKIFDRFFTIEEEEEPEKYRGSGLGLAFAKLVTEMLGGHIWAESKKAVGTTFYFQLPYMQVHLAPKPLEKTKSSKYYWPGKTIMIAEDDASNFLLIEAILKDTGITLLHVGDGVELLEKINAGIPIDLILLDIKMPRMSGTQAMKIIRESYPDVPVVVQTAYDRTSHRKQCQDMGCNEFLVKPLRKKEVLDILNKYLG